MLLYHGGDNAKRDPPVLIPNTEVKPLRANGTCLETSRESRSLPPFIKHSRKSWVFFICLCRFWEMNWCQCLRFRRGEDYFLHYATYFVLCQAIILDVVVFEHLIEFAYWVVKFAKDVKYAPKQMAAMLEDDEDQRWLKKTGFEPVFYFWSSSSSSKIDFGMLTYTFVWGFGWTCLEGDFRFLIENPSSVTMICDTAFPVWSEIFRSRS